MALVKCEECGQMVSEKATICPKCGASIEKKIHCKECGLEMSATIQTCPNCGCPIEDVQSDEQTNKNDWQSKSKYVQNSLNKMTLEKRPGRKKYKILGIIMLVISILYGIDYIFGHILFASGGMVYTSDIRNVISLLFALLFAIYGFICIYLYKN